MTPGTDEETLEGFSLASIREIIEEMRTEQFRFRPVRQQFIPKPNGKMRKLAIPCVRDKVVQEVMHLILEAIYDSPHAPYFQETSHGFGPQRSCHTALREVRTHWTGVNWYLEGDRRACFDELDHQVLVHILRKKIQDEPFLNLIRKLLKAGYMDLHGSKKESLIGSPQGGIISPMQGVEMQDASLAGATLRDTVFTEAFNAVQSLRISSDGHMLASCGDDSTIQVWDLENGEHLRTLRHDRPYERLDITGVKGLTQAQKATLRGLGATEDTPALITQQAP